MLVEVTVWMLVGDHLVGTGRKREAVQGHGMDSKMRRVWVWVSVCHVFLFYLTRHIILYHRRWRRNGDLD